MIIHLLALSDSIQNSWREKLHVLYEGFLVLLTLLYVRDDCNYEGHHPMTSINLMTSEVVECDFLLIIFYSVCILRGYYAWCLCVVYCLSWYFDTLLIIHSKLLLVRIPQTTEYCKCTLRYYLLTGSFWWRAVHWWNGWWIYFKHYECLKLGHRESNFPIDTPDVSPHRENKCCSLLWYNLIIFSSFFFRLKGKGLRLYRVEPPLSWHSVWVTLCY